MRRSSIHRRLRAETAALHHALESRLDLLAPELRLDRYRAVLRTFYGYHAALEPALARVVASSPVPAFLLRARADALARDLEALGADRQQLASIARCDELPRLTRREHLAGCLYVIEGAALGGAIIARAVECRLGLTPARGCAFFAGDADARGPRWQQVLDWLDQVATAGARCGEDEIVATACETFETLTRWTERQGVVR